MRKMSETAKPKPICHLCGDTLSLDGLILKRKDDTPLYMCYVCYDLIKAVVEDSLEEWSVKVKKRE